MLFDLNWKLGNINQQRQYTVTQLQQQKNNVEEQRAVIHEKEFSKIFFCN